MGKFLVGGYLVGGRVGGCLVGGMVDRCFVGDLWLVSRVLWWFLQVYFIVLYFIVLYCIVLYRVAVRINLVKIGWCFGAGDRRSYCAECMHLRY